MKPSSHPGPPPETVAACLCVLFAVLFALCDIHLFHPGLAWPDEFSLAQDIQRFSEGEALPFSYATGSLHRFLTALCALPGGPSVERMHLPAFAAFFAECAALYLLALRSLGAPAALWAVALNAAAGFTFMRLRSPLAYGVQPAELLGMLAVMPHCAARWRSFFWGMVAALLLAEYEAWALALPVLALAWAWSRDAARPRAAWSLAGLALGAAVLAALSKNELASHFAVRAAQSLGTGSGPGRGAVVLENLKGYWLGAKALAYTGLDHWPVFPGFAWPALAWGAALAFRRRPWMLLWACLGFAPLISANSAAEPQRMIMAWPALCLLAGWGFAAAGEALPQLRPALFGLLALGLGLETGAYLQSMRASYAGAYGYSQDLKRAAAAFGPDKGSYRLITDLDNESAGGERFLLAAAGLKSVENGKPLALIPWEYAAGIPADGKLVILGPRLAARLEAVEHELSAIWRSRPRFDVRGQGAAAAAYLASHPSADPWVKSACLEHALGQSFMMGEMPLDLLRRMENEPLQSVSGLIWAARGLQHSDPAWSKRLAARALALDPRRDDARGLALGPAL